MKRAEVAAGVEYLRRRDPVRRRFGPRARQTRQHPGLAGTRRVVEHAGYQAQFRGLPSARLYGALKSLFADSRTIHLRKQASRVSQKNEKGHYARKMAQDGVCLSENKLYNYLNFPTNGL